VEQKKKKKHLLGADFEGEGIDRVCVRRLISWTNPVKTMFMGVAFPPNPEHNFDGKIAIKRISRSRQHYVTLTTTTNSTWTTTSTSS
jgi:hypothetical protein